MQFKNLNENYIRVYDDVIPKLMCDHMIEEFEKNEDQFDKQTLKGHRSFTQITLQQYANWKPYQDNLQYAFNSCIDKYMEDCDICLLYTSPSPRDGLLSRMPSSA